MKTMLLCTAVLFTQLFFYATKVSSLIPGLNENAEEMEWKISFKDDLVQINYKYSECKLPSNGTHNEYVYLQYVNQTDKTVIVEYDIELWYNDKCLTCESSGAEYHYSITLKPGESVEGSCGEKSNKALYLFSKMLNGFSKSELTAFNLNNIKTSIK